MTQHVPVTKGEELIIHSPKTGYLLVRSAENRSEFEVSAILTVYVNAEALPGISELKINVNTFDVWRYDDVGVLKKIAAEVLKPEYKR